MSIFAWCCSFSFEIRGSTRQVIILHSLASNSEESMNQSDTGAKLDEDSRTSSSPSLKSLESHSSDQTDGSALSALYATVNKVKYSSVSVR